MVGDSTRVDGVWAQVNGIENESDRERITENGKTQRVSVSVNETRVGCAAVVTAAVVGTVVAAAVSCSVSGYDCGSPCGSS